MSAAEVFQRVTTEPGNADLCRDVPGLMALLQKHGWERVGSGKRETWEKGDRSLFIRSQGPENAAIVQWDETEPARLEVSAAAPGVFILGNDAAAIQECERRLGEAFQTTLPLAGAAGPPRMEG